MKLVNLILPAVALTVGMGSCRTTEANYRAAYDKAMAGRDSLDVEGEIYGSFRRQLNAAEIIAGTDTIQVKVQHVKVMEEDGTGPAELRAYCVVAGQFKQRFNAMSLRDRLIGDGYAGAFVVETAEPYYYVVASAHDSAKEAADALAGIKEAAPIVMREPVPFILHDPRTSLR